MAKRNLSLFKWLLRVRIHPRNTCVGDQTVSSYTAKVHTVQRWPNPSRSFDVLLTVHLSIFILVINQLDAQNLFYNKFISCLYMFRGPCAHRQEVKIVLYSIWYHHTYMFRAPCAHRQEVKIVLYSYSIWYHHTYRCDDTRCCIIQF